MGDNNLNIAIARAVLAGSSLYSLIECADMKYVRVAFGLYLVDGIIGVVDYVLPKSNQKVKKVMGVIDRISRPCYTPLVAAEAILYAGMDEKFSYCHLIIPAAYIVLTELLKKNINQEVLDLSTILNSVSICFSAYKKEDYLYGGLTALFNIVAFLGVQFNTMEYFIVIAVANLAAVQFLKQSLDAFIPK